MNNEELKTEEMMENNTNESTTIQNRKVLYCPVCNERLMYMQPNGNTLYCEKCKKYFKNNNESVGEETTNPYINKNAIY